MPFKSREEKNAYHRAWKKRHKVELNSRRNEFRRTVKGQYLQLKEKAKSRNLAVTISFSEFYEWISSVYLHWIAGGSHG